MGRVKTTKVKRVTYDLFREHKDEFKDNFEENKKIVEEFVDIKSKKMRNTIAGYMTRLVRKSKA